MRKNSIPLFVLVLVLAVSAACSRDARQREEVAKVNGVELRSDYIRFRLNLDMRRIGQNLNAQQKAKLAETIIDKEIVRELMYQEGQAKGSVVSSVTLEKERQEWKSLPGQIEALEPELHELPPRLADPEFLRGAPEEIRVAGQRVAEIPGGIDLAFDRWGQLDERA